MPSSWYSHCNWDRRKKEEIRGSPQSSGYPNAEVSSLESTFAIIQLLVFKEMFWSPNVISTFRH